MQIPIKLTTMVCFWGYRGLLLLGFYTGFGVQGLGSCCKVERLGRGLAVGFWV